MPPSSDASTIRRSRAVMGGQGFIRPSGMARGPRWIANVSVPRPAGHAAGVRRTFFALPADMGNLLFKGPSGPQLPQPLEGAVDQHLTAFGPDLVACRGRFLGHCTPDAGFDKTLPHHLS